MIKYIILCDACCVAENLPPVRFLWAWECNYIGKIRNALTGVFVRFKGIGIKGEKYPLQIAGAEKIKKQLIELLIV